MEESCSLPSLFSGGLGEGAYSPLPSGPHTPPQWLELVCGGVACLALVGVPYLISWRLLLVQSEEPCIHLASIVPLAEPSHQSVCPEAAHRSNERTTSFSAACRGGVTGVRGTEGRGL